MREKMTIETRSKEMDQIYDLIEKCLCSFLLRSDPTWQELSLRRAKKKRRCAFSGNNAYAADAERR